MDDQLFQNFSKPTKFGYPLRCPSLEPPAAHCTPPLNRFSCQFPTTAFFTKRSKTNRIDNSSSILTSSHLVSNFRPHTQFAQRPLLTRRNWTEYKFSHREEVYGEEIQLREYKFYFQPEPCRPDVGTAAGEHIFSLDSPKFSRTWCNNVIRERRKLFPLNVMWFFPIIRLASSTRIVRYSHFLRFKSAYAAVQLSSFFSDSTSDERVPNIDSLRAIEMLNSFREQPSSALQYFAQLKEDGFKHDVGTYVAIIRILCCCGWNRRIESIFLEVIKYETKHLGFNGTDLFNALVEELSVEGSNLFLTALEAMVKAYIRVDMFDEAFEVLLKTKMCGVDVSLRLCNYLMNSLVRFGKLDEALFVYKELEKLGLTPDGYTYGIVIKVFGRKGCLKEANDVLDEMIEAGISRDCFIYTSLIEACCSLGHPDLGNQLLYLSREESVPMDVYAFTVVLCGFLGEKKLKEAKSLLLDMYNYGPKPDGDFYSVLIRGFCEFGYIDESLAYLSEMKANNIQINCVIASSILKCLCQNRMFQKAIDQFQDFRELGIYLDKVVYNDVFDAYCKLGKTEAALTLLSEMTSKGIVPDLKNYTTMIDGFFLNGRVSDALELIKEMHKRGLKPDAATDNVIAGGFSRNGLVEEALGYLEKLKALNIKPSYCTLNMIIKGLFISGKVNIALDFFNSLEDEYRENGAGNLIDCAREYVNVKLAYELFIQLSEQGYRIKRSSGHKLMYSLLEARDIPERVIMRFFDVALSSVVGECMKMSGKVITALSKDMRNAQWAFDSLVCRGITPNEIIYTIMLNGYKKARRVDMVAAIFKDMRNRGITPNHKHCSAGWDLPKRK